MTTLIIILAFGFQIAANADTLPIAELPQDREILFSRDVAPVLKKNCIACHSVNNEEGGVNLESAALMLASDVEDVLVPGKPDASRLFLVASHADDPVMPPDGNDVSASVLKPMELALLRRWIQSGAVVDHVTNKPTERTWQPLPPTLRTVYGSAMTADGRLSAVSFGNQIRLFGAKSALPIGALEIHAGNQSKRAHDDFVQDLFLDPTGRRVISAGFRNVKLWEMAAFEPTSIPKINHNDVLAIAMNASGRHFAALSRQGKLSVAEIGSNHWQWMKSIDFPTGSGDDTPPKVQLAVGAAGHEAAFGSGNTIHIVRIDGKESQTINTTDTITSILWRGKNQLATADAAGHVVLWKRDGLQWVESRHSVFDQAVFGLYSAMQAPERLVAIDVSGEVANWNETDSTFNQTGKLPSPAVSASLSPTGNTLWLTTVTGIFGQFNIADKKFVEVAKSDPVAEARFATDNWQTLVGERLVAAHDKEVKQAQANTTAEKNSRETFTQEVEKKTKQRDEKQASIHKVKIAAEAAATKLAEAKSAEQIANKQRTELTKSVKQLSTRTSTLEEELAKLKQELSTARKQLAAIPDAKQLANAVELATGLANKANLTAKKTATELSNAVAALHLAEQTKVRGESRLKGLAAELQRQQKLLRHVKVDQEARKSKEAASKSLQAQSRATDQTLAVMAAGSRIVTRASNSDGGTSGAWSLWSQAGDWLAELSEIPAGGRLIASGDNGVLIKGTDGDVHAMKISTRLWHHQKTIGSSIGQSPFADRVLSIDVDPTGDLLATGGGESARMGELMIWKLSDGSLIRAIDKPHKDTVLCVRFSPDGKTLATASADRMIKLWNVQSGQLIKTLEGHTHHVTSIDWNVNRRQLASGSADSTVKIWDVHSGQTTRTIRGLKTEVTRLVFAGRDDRIGIVGGDSYFRVYRTDNGKRETNAKVAGGYLYALDCSRDGSQFIAGGAEGIAVVVDQSGKKLMQYQSKRD